MNQLQNPIGGVMTDPSIAWRYLVFTHSRRAGA